MEGTFVSATAQAASLSAASNLLAQAIKAHRQRVSLRIDWKPILDIVFFTVLTCPPNLLWGQYLEARYPSFVSDDYGNQALILANVVIKLTLDQSIGAMVNTAAFIAGMGLLKGNSHKQIAHDLHWNFWSLVRSGWSVWPVVALLNFTVVPPSGRVLVGSIAGLFWGVYMSLITDSL